MEPKDKALLYPGKALPASCHPRDNQAMLNDERTSTVIARRLQQYLEESKVRQTDIATACGVSKQAVQGWKKTGRIDKRMLATLAQFSGHPISWWLSEQDTHLAAQEPTTSYGPGVLTLSDPLIEEATAILKSLPSEQRRDALIMLRGFAAAAQREAADSTNPRAANA